MEEKYLRVKLKKSNEMTKRLPIRIPIIFILYVLVKNIVMGHLGHGQFLFSFFFYFLTL